MPKRSNSELEIDIGEIGKVLGLDLNLKGVKIKRTTRSDREEQLYVAYMKQKAIIKQLVAAMKDLQARLEVRDTRIRDLEEEVERLRPPGEGRVPTEGE